MNARETVRAQDLMTRDVATLSPEDTIQAALELFEEHGISGAPVVHHGKLVGLLSLTDVSRTGHLDQDRVQTQRAFELGPSDEETEDLELDPEEVFFSKRDYSAGVLGHQLVQDWMNAEVVSVPPQATLQEVCRVMAERHIHRVLVTEGGRLAGVVSSSDVVRHVAGLPREAGRASAAR